MKGVIGEVVANVTVRAPSFREEQIPAVDQPLAEFFRLVGVLLRVDAERGQSRRVLAIERGLDGGGVVLGEQGVVAGLFLADAVPHKQVGLIVEAVPGQDGPLVSGDCLGRGVLGRQVPEHGLECLHVLGVFPQADDRFLPRLARPGEHFERVRRRPLRLVFERRGPAIPELEVVVHTVNDRRRVHPAESLVDAQGRRPLVGVPLRRAVTGRARDRAVGRQNVVEVESFAEFPLGHGHRVFDRDRRGGGQPERHLDDDRPTGQQFPRDRVGGLLSRFIPVFRQGVPGFRVLASRQERDRHLIRERRDERVVRNGHVVRVSNRGLVRRVGDDRRRGQGEREG